MLSLCGMSGEAFFEYYYPKVYNYFYHTLSDKGSVEDLTSEVFMKIIRFAGQYDPAKSKPITWVMRICANVRTDHYRLMGRNGKCHGDRGLEALEAQTSIELGYDDVELRMLLDQLMESLSERERAVIYLRYYLDYSYSEIAMLEDLSEKNVSVILVRAMKKLRSRYSDTVEA